MESFGRVGDPRELGLDPRALARLDETLLVWTETGEPRLPAAAYVVGCGGRWLTPKFFGRMGPEPEAERLRTDAVFPIASITKPIVYTAILQLVEDGKLGLTDLVARHLPEFAGNGKQSVRLIHLLTHTSGLPENLASHPRLRRANASLDEYCQETCAAGLQFPAGADLTYSNPGSHVAAKLAETVAGRGMAALVAERICAPLEMTSATLGAGAVDQARIVRMAAGEGTTDWNGEYWRTLAAPWGGMFAGPEDLARFAAATVVGLRQPNGILSPATTRLMTRNVLGSSRLPELGERARMKERWGLGWKLNSPTGTAGSMVDLLGDRVFGHQGATGCVLWIDPETQLFFVLLTNQGVGRAPWRLIAASNMVVAALAV